jgi:hypothetical protein
MRQDPDLGLPIFGYFDLGLSEIEVGRDSPVAGQALAACNGNIDIVALRRS